MTISSISNRVSYAGNGSTTAFAVSYPFFEEDELLVIVETDSDGSESEQTLTTDYTVSGGEGSTGTVTMVTAPASGETLHIIRDTEAVQETDLVNNSAMDAETLEDALDRRAMREQRLFEHIERALRVPETEAALSRLPKADDRKDHFLYFDSSTGLPVVKTKADLGLDDSATSGENVAGYSALKARSTSSLSDGDSVFVTYRSSIGDGGHGWFAWRTGNQSTNITNDSGEVVWVPPDSDTAGASGAWERQFSGAVNALWGGPAVDGTTDDSTEIQNVLDYVGNTSEQWAVYFPPGEYSFESNLDVPQGVVLFGDPKGRQRRSSTQFKFPLTHGITSSTKTNASYALANLYIEGNSIKATNGQILVDFHGQNYAAIRNVHLTKTDIGLRVKGEDGGTNINSNYGRFSNIDIDSCNKAVLLERPGSANSHVFTGGRFWNNNTGAHLNIASGANGPNNIAFYSIFFESNGTNAVLSEGEEVLFSGCRFESNGAIDVSGGGKHWRVGCHFDSTTITGDLDEMLDDSDKQDNGGTLPETQTVSLNDDAVATFAIGTNAPFSAIVAFNDGSIVLHCRSAGSIGCWSAGSGGANTSVFNPMTGDNTLAGTTGSDTTINFAMDSSNNFYIENRTGGSRTGRVTIFKNTN